MGDRFRREQQGVPARSRNEIGQLVAQLDEWGEIHDSLLSKAHSCEISALAAHFAGNGEEARAKLIEGIRFYEAAGVRVTCFAHYLDHVALWALGEGNADTAARLLGSAEAIRADHAAAAAPPYERVWHDQAKDQTREVLGEILFQFHFGGGRETEPEEAARIVSDALTGGERVLTAIG